MAGKTGAESVESSGPVSPESRVLAPMMAWNVLPSEIIAHATFHQAA